MGETPNMISKPLLWEKLKDLTGTPDELERLKKIRDKLTTADYWIIRARWAENASKQKNSEII